MITFGKPFQGLHKNLTVPFQEEEEGALKMIFDENHVKVKMVPTHKIGVLEVEDTLRMHLTIRDVPLDVMLFPEESFERSSQGAIIQVSWMQVGEGMKTLHFDLKKGIKAVVQRTVNNSVEFWYDGPMLVV